MALLNLDNFVRARATLCREIAARRAERFDRPIHGPAFDDDAMVVDFIEDPPVAPVVFHLIYQDAKNDYSGRVVTVRRACREVADIRLGTYCQLRKMPRTFMASRIVEVTDIATGEVSEDGLDYFSHYPLLEGGIDTLVNLSLETMALQECRDEIILLSFIAAADEDFTDEERDEIVKHVMNRCPDDMSEVEIRRRVRNFVPDERAFEMALKRMCEGSGDARALMRSMRHVIDADGLYAIEEMAFAEEIEVKLRAAGRI